MRKAVDEEKRLNAEAGNIDDILSVSGDGSWSKRGFTSLVGIVTLIGKYTGKFWILLWDQVTAKLASENRRRNSRIHCLVLHAQNVCSANHKGKMEVDGRNVYAIC